MGVLDDNTNFVRTEQYNTGQRSRVILFDSNGQLVLRNGLAVATYAAGTTYNTGDAVSSGSTTWVCVRGTQQMPSSTNVTPATNGTQWREEQWYLNATSGSPNDGNSNPGILIWDDNELNSSGATTDATRGAWILKNADVVIVNAYTGNLIDGLK